jgi:hypothetical protein
MNTTPVNSNKYYGFGIAYYYSYAYLGIEENYQEINE